MSGPAGPASVVTVSCAGCFCATVIGQPDKLCVYVWVGLYFSSQFLRVAVHCGEKGPGDLVGVFVSGCSPVDRPGCMRCG